MAIRILSYHVQEMRVGFVVRLAHSVKKLGRGVAGKVSRVEHVFHNLLLVEIRLKPLDNHMKRLKRWRTLAEL